MIKTIRGDLMKATETYLCHQCNCVTNRSAHLAKSVFKNFPYADVYTHRKQHSKPGSIELRGDGKEQRFVVALFGQYYPGVTKYPNSPKDGWNARFKYFTQALEELKKLPEGSFAFPWRIGCGAAGGKWEHYYEAIKGFSESINSDVVIYRLDKPKIQSPDGDLF